MLSPVLCALSAGSCGFVCFSVGAGLLFRWRREADFGGLLRFLPPVLCGARLSLRVGSVLWGMSTAPLVFDVLLGDATSLEDPVHSLPYSVSPLGRPI